MRLNKVTILLVGLLASIHSYTYALDSLNIEMLSRIELCWNVISDIAVYDDLAYVATGETGIKIIDISNIENPVELNALQGVFYSVTLLDETYLFTGELSTNSLQIYTLDDPTSPSFFTSTELEMYPDEIYDIRFHSHYALFTSHFDDLYLVDIEDIENPVVLGNVLNQDYYRISGDYIYAIDWGFGLYIYDITDLENPVEMSNLELEGHVRDLVVVDDYAYIASLVPGVLPDLFYVVNVSDPESPEIAATIDNFDFESGVDSAVLFDENTILHSYRDNINVYDISEPESPDLIATLEATSQKMLVENTMIVGFDGDNISFIDFSDRTDPEVLSEFGNADHIYGFDILGEYAYLTSNLGLHIYDVSDPSTPVQVNTVNGEYFSNISIYNNHAYIASWNELDIYNLADPEQPQWVCTYSPDNREYPIGLLEFSGNYVFLSRYPYDDDETDIYVIDISDPSTPELSETITVNGSLGGMTLANDRLLAMTSGGLGYRIIRMFDTLQPHHLNELGFSDVMLLDNWIISLGFNAFAYSHTDDEMKIFSTNSGFIINEIGSFPTDDISSLYDLKISGSQLFCLARSSNWDPHDIEIYNVSDIESPERVGYYGCPHYFDEISVQEDILYAIDDCRLSIMQLNLPSVPSEFTLMEPVEGTDILFDDADEITLSWLPSSLPDPLDPPVYSLNLRAVTGDDIDTTFSWINLTAESLAVNLYHLLETDEFESDIDAIWWVQASGNDQLRDCDAACRFTVTDLDDVNEPQPGKMPDQFGISSVYPNPFNNITVISVSLHQSASLAVSLYNIIGEEVAIIARESFTAGNHDFTLNGDQLASGIYFVRAQLPGKIDQIQKVVLIK